MDTQLITSRLLKSLQSRILVIFLSAVCYEYKKQWILRHQQERGKLWIPFGKVPRHNSCSVFIKQLPFCFLSAVSKVINSSFELIPVINRNGWNKSEKKIIWVCNCLLQNQPCRGTLAHLNPVVFFLKQKGCDNLQVRWN